MEKNKKSTAKKRIVPILNYHVRDFQEYDSLASMKETKTLVFKNLLEAVKQSLISKKDTADIFLLNTEICVVLDKSKWKPSLENAIDFFSQEGIEDYEICKACKEIINKL